MAKIKTLKDSEGNSFYPQTHTKGIVDDNGNNLEAIFSEQGKQLDSKIAEHSTVRFDRIEENEAPINAGEVGSTPTAIVYYKPSNIFVVADSSGAYWDTWDGMEAYMSGGAIRKDKVYLCGENVYNWDKAGIIKVNTENIPLTRNIFNAYYIIRERAMGYDILVQGNTLVTQKDSACDIIELPVKPNTDYAISGGWSKTAALTVLVDENYIILNDNIKDRGDKIISGHPKAAKLIMYTRYNGEPTGTNIQIEEGAEFTPYVEPLFGVKDIKKIDKLNSEKIAELKANVSANKAEVELFKAEVENTPLTRNVFNVNYTIKGRNFDYSTINQGNTLVTQKDSTCDIIELPVKPNTDYAISAETWLLNPIAVLVDENNVVLNDNAKGNGNKVLVGKSNASRLLMYTRYNGNNVGIGIQIEEGTEFTTYVEPLFGVKDINVIHEKITERIPLTRNVFNCKYIVKGVAMGWSSLAQGNTLNLLPDSSCDIIELPVKPNTDYAISGAWSKTAALTALVDENYIILNDNIKDRGDKIISGHPKAAKLIMYTRYNGEPTGTDIQIEEGVEFTPYVEPLFGVSHIKDLDTMQTNDIVPRKTTSLRAGINRFRFKYNKNLCNSSGSELICSIGKTPVHVYIDHSPATSELFYQKENQLYQDDLYKLELPMASMKTSIRVAGSVVQEQTLLLDGSPYQTLLRQQPPIMIQFVAEKEQLASYRDMRLYVLSENGICTQILIKKGNDIVYSYDIDTSMSMYNFYTKLKTEVEAIQSYQFKVTFSNIEGLKLEDMVATKAEGLPFVTQFSSDCTISGSLVYDNYPVILEFQDNRVYNLDISCKGREIRVYIDGINIPLSSTLLGSWNEIKFGDSIDVIESIYTNKETLNPMSLVHGFLSHALRNAPAGDGEYSLSIPVGSVSAIATKAKNSGFANLSVEEIGMAYIRNEPLPGRCYFIELDDFATLEWFQKMLSDEDEDGLRVMEILKMHGIKMGFAQEFSGETDLFNKILGGTASEVEKNTLSARFSNDKINKIRSMMASFKWTISIHTLVDGVDPTRARFDDFVNAVRKTVACYERMYERSPMIHVTSGTGNSSPYFRRMFPVYGIPIVVQDKQLYCNGNFLTYLSRGHIYADTNLLDIDYGVTNLVG